MSKIKVSELFNSIQGEGRYAGAPSVFLRSFGCNLRCPGFGRTHDADTPNTDVQSIVEHIPEFKRQGKTFEQLPLVKTGCDTYAAVYPEFKDFSPMLDVDSLVQRIKALLPRGTFHREQHLILTGGEPLLPGWQRVYPELVKRLYAEKMVEGKLNLTIETNGTQRINQEHFGTLGMDTNLHFSVSPKLMASGEPRAETIVPEAIYEYMRYGLVDFKFVVDCEKGVSEILDVLDNEYKYIWKSFMFGSVYLMPEGGTNEQYAKNAPLVADLAIKHGFRFSPRLQNSLYANEWGT